MKTTLENIRQEAIQKIESAQNEEQLREVEIEFLGRKQGKIALLLREVPKLPVEQRPEIGKRGNEIKREIEQLITTKQNEAKLIAEQVQFFDYTVPGNRNSDAGKLHPVSAFIREAEDVFGRLGFDIADGPEVEDEHHNFNALNMPEHHPAREMQDTFWVSNLERYVLRTQTSNVQIHTMEKNTPPFRIISLGKVFRKDSDTTHSPMFHQIEGLMVDRDVSLSHLKFVLLSALRELISVNLELRFRVSYFPFTEPSLEVDASCPICDGAKKSCRVCKGSGWLEIGGAGMVHPNVLKNVGLDPQEWNGFAFGFGIERQVMIRHQIDDLRQFYENDIRFLQQF